MTRWLPVGPYAVLAEVEDVTQAQAVYRALRAADGLDALVDLVPAARTVLAVARPNDEGRACLGRLPSIVDGAATGTRAADGPVVELSVSYDGPDLRDTAALLRMAPEELVRRHAAAEYRVAFSGFAPGFGYLTGLPPELYVPRLPTPRTNVPAGSVGLAGEFCGVYPRGSPGGWRLLGRTEAVLWNADRDPAALLVPGARVRFRPETTRAPTPPTRRPAEETTRAPTPPTRRPAEENP
jgi:KipI family sensor histidine kinase inhibitor